MVFLYIFITNIVTDIKKIILTQTYKFMMEDNKPLEDNKKIIDDNNKIQIMNPIINGKKINLKIYEFLESWKHLPEQGTKEWLDGRLTTIGGSELENCVKNEGKSRNIVQK